MFLNELDFIRPEDLPDLSAAAGGAAAGTAVAKPLGMGRITGALGGLGAGLSAKDAYDRYKNKDYVGAGIAAAGGVAGLVPNPVIGIGGPTLAAAINMCRDDPEACKDLLAGAKRDQPQLFEPRQRVTPAELVQKKKERQLKTKTNNENDASKLPEDREVFQASPNLIKSIKDVESGNNPAAVSPKGALGTMQVMPPTAKDPGFGVQPAKDFSPTELERVGQDYFNAMLNKYGGDKRLALIAYNMGPTAADKWLAKGADPSRLPKETQGYVPKVLSRYQQSDATTPVQTASIPNRTTDRVVKPATKPVQTQPMFTGQDSPRVPYAYTAPPGQKKSNFATLNPNWTPPPGPVVAPRPNPQDLEKLIKLKDRPKSIDDIINKARKKDISQDSIMNLLNKVALNTADQDPETVSLIQKLFADNIVAEQSNLNENTNRLADKIYHVLETNYGDLVQLYGHEVVGDAIQEVVLKSENVIMPDIEELSQTVLDLLNNRLEEQLQEPKDSESEDDKDVEHHNAVIQIQADLDKIKNTLDIKESKMYFNVVATSAYDLKTKFGLLHDSKGWYLNENADPNLKLDAIRTFNIL